MNTKEQYHQLQSELQTVLPTLAKAADAILDQEISKYPIFALSRQSLAMGSPLIEREAPEWSINATTLEEFATKGLIEAAKINNFRKVYKNPEEHICLFVVEEEGATFVFLPRK